MRASSSSDSVSGPATYSPVLGFTAPRFPTPCWTVSTCGGYQLAQKVDTIPPWCVMSRYQSAAPSQMHIAVRCGGWRDATCHWLMA